jgi:hypothetical protein
MMKALKINWLRLSGCLKSHRCAIFEPIFRKNEYMIFFTFFL